MLCRTFVAWAIASFAIGLFPTLADRSLLLNLTHTTRHLTADCTDLLDTPESLSVSFAQSAVKVLADFLASIQAVWTDQ